MWKWVQVTAGEAERTLPNHHPVPNTTMERDYFSFLWRCVERARTRETKIQGADQRAISPCGLSPSVAQSRHPQDKNKPNMNRSSSLPPLRLGAFLKTAVPLAALLAFGHSGTAAQRQGEMTVGTMEFHRRGDTAADKPATESHGRARVGRAPLKPKRCLQENGYRDYSWRAQSFT